MTAEEIINLLERANKPISRKEIMEDLDWDNPSRVTHALARLIKSKEVDFRWISCEEARKRDIHTNRRVRVYFVK